MTVRAVLTVLLGGALLQGCSDTEGTKVGWGGREGQPSCVYDAAASTVDCLIAVTLPDDGSVTVEVTAFADENTSEPVGSERVTVESDRAGRQLVHVLVEVDGEPHVDIDGETACTLAID